MHPDLIAALVQDRCKSWRCRAVTRQPYHPCRQRLARHTGRSLQSAVRRPADRQTKAWGWALAGAVSMLRIISMGARS